MDVVEETYVVPEGSSSLAHDVQYTAVTLDALAADPPGRVAYVRASRVYVSNTRLRDLLAKHMDPAYASRELEEHPLSQALRIKARKEASRRAASEKAESGGSREEQREETSTDDAWEDIQAISLYTRAEVELPPIPAPAAPARPAVKSRFGANLKERKRQRDEEERQRQLQEAAERLEEQRISFAESMSRVRERSQQGDRRPMGLRREMGAEVAMDAPAGAAWGGSAPPTAPSVSQARPLAGVSLSALQAVSAAVGPDQVRPPKRSRPSKIGVDEVARVVRSVLTPYLDGTHVKSKEAFKKLCKSLVEKFVRTVETWYREGKTVSEERVKAGAKKWVAAYFARHGQDKADP